MREKLLKKLSIVVLVFMLIVPNLTGMGIFAEAETTTVTIIENIITSVELEAKNASGIPVEEIVFEQGAEVNLFYKWKLENGHGYGNGATFIFTVPDAFYIGNNVGGDLTSKNGSVGTWSLDKTSRKVTMIFNENIELDEVEGTIELNTKFDMQKIVGSAIQELTFPISGGDETILVKFKPKNATAIEKKGISLKGAQEQKLNADTLQWTIDINKTFNTIKDATVSDVIPSGLELDNLKVYKLNVQLDGSASLGAEVDQSDYSFIPNGNSLSVFLGDIDEAYRIVYITKITDSSENLTLSFINNATLSGTNIADASTSATVSVNRGLPLDKKSSGYDDTTQTLSWEIRFNYDEKTIASGSAKIIDRFIGTQELQGLEIYNVTFDANGNERQGAKLNSSAYSLSKVSNDNGKNGFDLEFSEEIRSAYLIKYTTKALVPINNESTITNEATFGTIIKTASRPINPKFINKTVTNVNYQHGVKTVDWKINVYVNSDSLEDLEITDVFKIEGLELIPESIKINNNSIQPELVTYTTNGFIIKFDQAVTSSFTITYTTKFIDGVLAGKQGFNNEASLKWEGDLDVEDKYQTITTPFTPNPYTQNNGYKFGSYNPVTKEITWTIGANYNGKTIEDAVLEDVLLSNQKLIENSIIVKHMNIAANGEPSKGVDAVNYTMEYDRVNNVIRVKFNSTIDSPYIIEFRTKLENVVVDKKIENTASLLGNQKNLIDKWTAFVSVPHGEEYVSKGGKQDGELIDWTIYINRGQSFVKDAKIVDIPSGNQILLKHTFKLYEATVNKENDVTKGSLVASNLYDITFLEDVSGNEIFELSFKNDIDRAYVLEYQSLITAANNEKVSNSVSFTGEGVSKGSRESVEEITVALTSGVGTGSGVNRQLTLTKVDDENLTLTLKGATFTLERVLSNGNRILMDTLTTDDHGEVVFKKLLLGKYILTEIEAPYGYYLDGVEREINIISNDPTATTDPITNIANYSYTFENKRIKGELVVIKQDKKDANTKLEGAEFTLYRVTAPTRTQIGAPETTDVDGKITFSDLELGDYILVETKAPTGYVVDKKEHKITIDSDVSIEYNVENRKYSPAYPITPTEPEEPTDPETPTAPEEPTEPEEATEPTEPEKPTVPVNTPKDTPKEGEVEVSKESTPPKVGEQPKNGKVTVDPTGKWKYTPNKGFIGRDKFSIIVTDENGNEVEVFFEIDVEDVPFSGISVLPKTGEDSKLPLQLTGVSLILLGLGIAFIKRRTRN